ncbi:lanthionine synthetase LanC family protein [Lactiplantibacillus plantarum]|uniref:lanthionine synthetase LanC family protein n=1 Tax=Lactiplantibacillus plantarum TaxID=1590 RepID=UPI001AAEFA22|nr:lanthionine synthetase LanC family protein [Lactiplantibacillus plantarum]MBO2705783.1 DUF4135 domain-containing protein [Lactiplantibacillus plantarum]MDN7038283.1 DUF4135 domain-containing protein [Lactiplantibacillus plantarum]MDO7795375.1 lanthionine synthetase LanC family protein [Lactiplantibacillus plantarum]WVI00478.1 lanthionine synthetase LanC family protein [Lactiplantibacillus plantarum]
MENSLCTVNQIKDTMLINILKKTILNQIDKNELSSMENHLLAPTIEILNNHLLSVAAESIIFFRKNNCLQKNLEKQFWISFPELKRIVIETVDERVDTFKKILNVLIQSNYKVEKVKKIIPLGSDFHKGFGTYEAVLDNKNIILKLKIANLDCIYTEVFETLKDDSKTTIKHDYTGAYIQAKILPKVTTNCTELYKDMGRNLFTAYLLGCTDLHEENVIISGNQLKLIDCETMFEYDPVTNVDNQAYSLYSSVLHTGLLPDSSYSGVILSGLSDVNARTMLRSSFKYQLVDGMLVKNKVEFTKLNVFLNKPINFNLHLFDHKLEILSGFEEYYKSFLEKKEQIKEQIIGYSQHAKVRVLLHDTVNYYQLLSQSYHPYLMMNSFAKKQFLNGIEGITEAEEKDLADGYVPYIVDNAKVSGKTFCKFSQQDLKRQRIIISSVLKFEQEFKNMIRHKAKLPSLVEPVTRAAVYERIQDIDRLVDKVSFTDMFGNRIWLDKILEGNQFDTSKYDYQVICAPQNIYYGQAGLLLLFSKFERISGIYLHNTKILENQLLSMLVDSRNKSNLPMGFLNGQSGILYALFKSNTIKPSMFFYTLCNSYLEQAISHDELDFSGGVAGILKVLIAFWKKSKSPVLKTILEKGVHCLVSKYDSKFKGWHFIGLEGYVYGYAHGNIGVLAQLIQASELINYDLDSNLVSEIISKYYNDYSSNWPISSVERKFVDNWCHGAPGIIYGLADIYSFLDVSDKSMIRPLIYECLPRLIEVKHRDNCLCHGDFGNLMIYKHVIKRLHFDDIENLVKSNLILNSLFREESIEASTISFMCGESGILFFLMDII